MSTGRKIIDLYHLMNEYLDMRAIMQDCLNYYKKIEHYPLINTCTEMILNLNNKIDQCKKNILVLEKGE